MVSPNHLNKTIISILTSLQTWFINTNVKRFIMLVTDKSKFEHNNYTMQSSDSLCARSVLIVIAERFRNKIDQTRI